MESIERRAKQIEALEALEEAARAAASRPALIRSARELSIPWPDIAEALHMSVPGVTRMSKADVPEIP